jgi:hypothetical protein
MTFEAGFAILAKVLKLGELLGIKNKWAGYLVSLISYGLLATALYKGHAYVVQRQYTAAYQAGNQAASKTIAAQSAATAASAVANQAASAAIKANSDIDRAQATGKAQAQQERSITNHFDALEEQARHVAAKTKPSTTADLDHLCALPADRLRIWRAANAGLGGVDVAAPATRADQAPSQFAHRAQPTASTGLGQASRPGSQPPRCSKAVPPAGHADVLAHCLR